MPKVLPQLDIIPTPPSQTDLVSFGKVLQKFYQNLARVINGLIGFGDGTNSDNINGAWATVADTGAANTNFTVTHNLGRVPVGYLLMTSSVATSVYTGSVAATATQITLKSSTAHVAVSLFIL